MTSAFCAARVTVVAQASGDFAGSHPYARIKRAGPRRNSATASALARNFPSATRRHFFAAMMTA